jgi:hypothetical protein
MIAQKRNGETGEEHVVEDIAKCRKRNPRK